MERRFSSPGSLTRTRSWMVFTPPESVPPCCGKIEKLLVIAFRPPRERILKIDALFTQVPFEKRAAVVRRNVQVLGRRFDQDFRPSILIKILMNDLDFVALQHLVGLHFRREEFPVKRLPQMRKIEAAENAVPVGAVALPRPERVQHLLRPAV